MKHNCNYYQLKINRKKNFIYIKQWYKIRDYSDIDCGHLIQAHMTKPTGGNIRERIIGIQAHVVKKDNDIYMYLRSTYIRARAHVS